MSTTTREKTSPRQAADGAAKLSEPTPTRLGRLRGRRWFRLVLVAGFLALSACIIQLASMTDDSEIWLNFRRFWQIVPTADIAVTWPVSSPFAPAWRFGGAMLVLGAILSVFWALTNRFWLAGAMLLAGWLVMAFSNACKTTTLGVPLLPADFTLAGDTIRVLNGSYLPFGGREKIAVLVVLLVVAGVLLWLAGKYPIRPRIRMASGLPAAAFIATLFIPGANLFALMTNSYPQFNWSPRVTYSQNGFVAGLAMYCRFLWVEAPPGYSRQTMMELAKRLGPEDAGQPQGPRPDVIVILSEAFQDPTQFPGVEFVTDPIPTVHQLQKEFGQLDLISPVFGGLTCDAEFEVITGFNMAFMPQGSGAYVDYIRRPTPSLASILRGLGYSTIALHAVGGIHSDTQIQPLLGFQSLEFGPTWPSQHLVAGWVDDESTTREIIRRSGQLTAPFFICVNTMEGHSPYPKGRYDTVSDIRFTKPMCDDTKVQLGVYTQSMTRADAALKLLIDHFRDSPRPTLIVFYGDHLPIIGDDLRAYRETGYYHYGDRYGDCLPMRRKPVVIWNNFDRKLQAPNAVRPSDSESPVPLIGMHQLLPVLLDLVGAPKPPHVRLIEQIGKRWPVIGTAGCVRGDGTVESFDTVKDSQDILDYRLIQYDMLFGRQYLAKP